MTKLAPALLCLSLVACSLSLPVAPDANWRTSIQEEPLALDTYNQVVAGAFVECDPRIRLEARGDDRLLVFWPDDGLLVIQGGVHSYPPDPERRIELI